MPIVKPEQKQAGGGAGKFTGILPVSITNFSLRTDEFDWADLFISIEVAVQGSDYSRFIEIAGDLEKDGKGLITGGAVLNRMYKVFEQLGFTGGLTAEGTWEDGDGSQIDDIAAFLNERYLTGNPVDNDYRYVTYVYKAKPKKVGDKVWTRCLPRLYPNNDNGVKEMEGFVKWMKNNGYLKEASEKPETPSEITESALDNL